MGIQRRPIRTAGAQRFSHVRDAEDPRWLVKLGRGQFLVAAAPVQSFVVGGGNPGHFTECAHAREDFHRPLWMVSHRIPLSRIELPGLVQNSIRHAELSDIAQQRPSMQGRPRRCIDIEQRGQRQSQWRPRLQSDRR